MHCGQSFFFLLLNNCFTILYRFLPHINMNQSQAYLCLHPAERPSHLPPIPPLKVVTEHWAELPGWLTSDFLLVTRSWFLFQPFLLAFATSERATLSVENTLSSLSCWLLPQSQLLSGQRFEEKESSKPHLPFQILGINAVVICSSHQASPEEWAGPSVGSNQQVGTAAQLPLFPQAAVMTLEA